jgi:serine/threonine protein kinase
MAEIDDTPSQWFPMLNARAHLATPLKSEWKFSHYLDERQHVYAAKNSQNIACAIKCISVTQSLSLAIELPVLEQLHNVPGILCMIHWAFDRETRTILIQFPLMHTDLYHFIRSKRHNPGARRNLYVENVGGILQAIAQVHARGIIHRDIKSENIFCDKEHYWFLGDFGNAAYYLKPSDKFHTDMANTVTHRPPECFVDAVELAYDYKIDIWALGIVFFELWIGYLPTKNTFDYQRLRFFFTNYPCESWNEMKLIESTQPLLYQLLKGCLQKDPKKRLSADQLLQLPIFHQQ